MCIYGGKDKELVLNLVETLNAIENRLLINYTRVLNLVYAGNKLKKRKYFVSINPKMSYISNA